MTIAELLRDALLEIAVIDPIDPTPWDQQSLALTRFNGIIDLWNASQIATYTKTFTSYTLTPLLSPHTIGPTGTFVVSQRPVALLGANLQQNSGVNLVNIPINLRDDRWWLMQPTQNIQSGIPTDVYYAPDWTNANGSLYFWPVPDVAYPVQIEVRFVLAQIAEADVTNAFSMPPGYQRALMLTLAEDLTGPLSIPMPQDLPRKAREARAAVFANNNNPVRIRTLQAGMPGGDRGRDAGGFNWKTGTGAGR